MSDIKNELEEAIEAKFSDYSKEELYKELPIESKTEWNPYDHLSRAQRRAFHKQFKLPTFSKQFNQFAEKRFK